MVRDGVIGDYRTPDRVRFGPVPINTSFAEVRAAMERLRDITATKSYNDIPLAQSRVT